MSVGPLGRGDRRAPPLARRSRLRPPGPLGGGSPPVPVGPALGRARAAAGSAAVHPSGSGDASAPPTSTPACFGPPPSRPHQPPARRGGWAPAPDPAAAGRRHCGGSPGSPPLGASSRGGGARWAPGARAHSPGAAAGRLPCRRERASAPNMWALPGFAARPGPLQSARRPNECCDAARRLRRLAASRGPARASPWATAARQYGGARLGLCPTGGRPAWSVIAIAWHPGLGCHLGRGAALAVCGARRGAQPPRALSSRLQPSTADRPPSLRPRIPLCRISGHQLFPSPRRRPRLRSWRSPRGLTRSCSSRSRLPCKPDKSRRRSLTARPMEPRSAQAHDGRVLRARPTRGVGRHPAARPRSG